jgi:histidine triad (HIT) family protein
MTNCTFCKILSGSLSSSKVYEDENVMAFLDIHPISDGHTLIIPRRHIESLTSLSLEEVARIAQIGQVVATNLKRVLPECQGITLSLADGIAAGQEVPHAHLHVIPRHEGDGFGWKLPPNRSEVTTERKKLDAIAEHLRKSIYTEEHTS